MGGFPYFMDNFIFTNCITQKINTLETSRVFTGVGINRFFQTIYLY